jgi:hypothetical protein
MFATGIGLVLKGHQHSLRRAKASGRKKSNVRSGSKSRQGFFDRIVAKSQDFFNDDDI